MIQNASFSRNTAVMAVGTLLSRITGFGRAAAIAYAIGFGRLADTYLLANNTPNIIYELVLGGVLSATLVPVFVAQFAKNDEGTARQNIAAINTIAIAILTALCAVLAITAPWVIKLYTFANTSSDSDAQQEAATFMLRLFAPQLLFYGLISISTAMLNARKRFTAPMFAPILNNLIVIGVILGLPHIADSISLEAIRNDTGSLLFLGVGTTCGVIAMAVVLLASLKRAKCSFQFRWDPHNPAVKTVLRLSGWTFGFVAANQIALWIILVLANKQHGGVASYNFAYIFFLLPHGIFTVSLMSALQPDLAEHWSNNRIDKYRERLTFGIRMTALVLVPAAVGYALLAKPIVTLVLQHGVLEAAAANTTAEVLALMVLGLPAFSIYLLIMRAFQAIQDTRSMFMLYAAENVVNIVLALILYPRLGVQGLGLAWGLAYGVGTILALVVIRKRSLGIEGAALVNSITRIAAAAAIMGGAVLATEYMSSQLHIALLIRVTAAVLVGVTVYLIAARLLQVRELDSLLNLRKSRRAVAEPMETPEEVQGVDK